MTASVLDSLNAALASARGRILAKEDALARVSEHIFLRAGETAAERFETKVLTHVPVAASANGNGTPPSWSPPHQDEVVDVAAIARELRKKSEPVRRAAIDEFRPEIERIADEHGIPIAWDVVNPFIGNVLAGAAAHVTSIAGTTQLNVVRTIREAHERGLTIEETATAIRQGMRAASPVRARLIATTELAAISNGGALAATTIVAQATGETYWKCWATAPGAEWPRHEDVEGLNGQVRALAEPFDCDGVAMDFPADPDGPPDEVCRCRCVMLMLDCAESSESMPWRCSGVGIGDETPANPLREPATRGPRDRAAPILARGALAEYQ
jgi:hypothetical protein